MEINAEQLIANAIRDGLAKCVNEKICGYKSPLEPLIESAIKTHEGELRQMLLDALQSCIGDAQFAADLKAHIRSKLAKTLIARFGGELEKQVNVLKSDPSTRAKITVAIEEIIAAKD